MARRCIGIVREVYNKWERRAPLCPKHVANLVQNHGIRVLVQPSNRRVFSDSEFEAAGAEITSDLSDASTIFGVKQVPISNLLPDRTYVFFSHVIKAQPENMKLLDTVLARNVRLIDYECITQDGKRSSPRTIAFGKFAGYAGMIDMFRGLGERLLSQGYSTPFLNVGSTYMYPSLENAKRAVGEMGHQIADGGLPEALSPMTFVFTGTGNVSQGAQDIFKLVPHEFVSCSDLKEIASAKGPEHQKKLYGAVATAEDMVELRSNEEGQTFDRSHYYAHPDLYRPTFHNKVAPYTSVIM